MRCSTIRVPHSVLIRANGTGRGALPVQSLDSWLEVVEPSRHRTTDVWELTHKDGSVWRFGQSDLGTLAASFLTEIVDPQGNATQITRRSDHKITAIGSSERAHVYHYGSNGLVDSITDPAGRSPSFTYNAQRRIETATDADGGVTRYSYVDDNEFPPSPVCTQGTDGLRIKTIEYPASVRSSPNLRWLDTAPRISASDRGHLLGAPHIVRNPASAEYRSGEHAVLDPTKRIHDPIGTDVCIEQRNGGDPT